MHDDLSPVQVDSMRVSLCMMTYPPVQVDSLSIISVHDDLPPVQVDSLMVLQVLKTSIKLSTYGALPLAVIPLLFPAGFSNLQLRFPRYVSKMVF